MASWYRKEDSRPYETTEFFVSGLIPMFLIVIGTLGNLIVILILLTKQNRRTSTNTYLIFLCLMDTISLYQWNLSQAMYTFTKGAQQIWGGSLILCKLSQFFAFYTLHTSAMFLTLVELDRVCLLRSIWYKRKIARPRIAILFCTIILLLLFVLNGFLFALGTEYFIYDNSTRTQSAVVECYYSNNTNLNQFFADQYSWIHLVVMYFLPFTVIFVCTIFTVKKLIVKRLSRNGQLSNNAQRNRRISIMLLLMCFAYVIFTLPNRLCFSVFSAQIIGHEYTDTVFLTTNTLMYTRNAMNAFFLYISVCGFRRDIHKLVARCLGKSPTQVGTIHCHMTKDNMAIIMGHPQRSRMTTSRILVSTT